MLFQQRRIYDFTIVLCVRVAANTCFSGSPENWKGLDVCDNEIRRNTTEPLGFLGEIRQNKLEPIWGRIRNTMKYAGCLRCSIASVGSPGLPTLIAFVVQPKRAVQEFAP